MPCVPLFNSIHALVSFVIEINKEVTHGSFHRLSTVPLISPTGMVSVLFNCKKEKTRQRRERVLFFLQFKQHSTLSNLGVTLYNLGWFLSVVGSFVFNSCFRSFLSLHYN